MAAAVGKGQQWQQTAMATGGSGRQWQWQQHLRQLATEEKGRAGAAELSDCVSVRSVRIAAALPVRPQWCKDFLHRREGQTMHYGLRKVLRFAASKTALIRECYIMRVLWYLFRVLTYQSLVTTL